LVFLRQMDLKKFYQHSEKLRSSMQEI